MSELAVKVRYLANFDTFELAHRAHKDIDGSRRGHTAVHIGYESGDWNYREFLLWLQKHIPEYSLTPSELESLSDPTKLFALATNASRLLHDRDKNISKKGEIGEIILHGLIRDIYSTTPLVSKIYYKSHPSDNVKGFDCVHVIFDEATQTIDSIWLGEAKFYTDPTRAIGKAFESVIGFLEAKKMQKELLTIRNHFDDKNVATKSAEALLSEYTSLDEIKAKLCVPVLIAYESGATKAHTKISDNFLEELDNEIEANLKTFLEKFNSNETLEVDIHVFFLPLRNKEEALRVYKEHVDGFQGSRRIY